MTSAHGSPTGSRPGLLKTLTAVNVGVLVVNLLVTMQPSPRDRAAARRAEPRRAHPPPPIVRDLAQGLGDRVTLTGASEARKREAPREMRVKLTEEQLHDLLEHVYREERLWRRTTGVLHALSRLQTKGVLPELGETTCERIVALAREYAGQRARLERAVMGADFSRMRARRDDLAAFDQREIKRIETELNTILSAAEAARIARVIVPGIA